MDAHPLYLDFSINLLLIFQVHITFDPWVSILVIPVNVMNVADVADVDKSYYFRSQNHCTTD